MKKKVKKLVLSKETVRKLEDGQLVEADGGITYPGCSTPGWICVDIPSEANTIC